MKDGLEGTFYILRPERDVAKGMGFTPERYLTIEQAIGLFGREAIAKALRAAADGIEKDGFYR